MSNDRDDPDRDDREDLEERIEELETTLRGLQTELGRPPRGPMGLPRPPTPREVLSFTGEYAIPTLITMLEANVRALKALQQIIRLVDPEYDPTEQARSDLSARAGRASRATLDRLQDTLNDVEGALTEGGLPEEPRARRILEDARRLSDDIREEVSAGSEQADEGRELADNSDAEEAELEEEVDQPEVDVDAELRSIRDELGVRGNGSGDEDSDDESASADDESGPDDDPDA
ncbi:hypothetical protein BG842_19670 [Haladaptatus sp. W1]|uniref:DUF7547 family protein n=1 Tax=Haladaptatus sp. W1 TaxID=1897478 RepID=UPI000849E0B4|nr:hypothetical protein [Haladaptatus sp. W1]ODR82219.1 hypothetical protein BG842_19670 [Haladaptatus sp. W1]